MKKIIYYFLILASPLLFFTGCDDSPTEPPETPSRGDLVEVTSKDTIRRGGIELFLNQIPDEQNFDVEIQNDIVLVSIVYKTLDHKGNLVDASGLLVEPLSDAAHPLISLHHGTQTKRENVGSDNAIYSFDAVIGGALGYLAVSPDYLGLGISSGLHPYHHEKTSASTSIDMLHAAKQYCRSSNIELSEQLFLAGYSQGGYVTLAVHKEMERNYPNEFKVTASAPMAGAYDLLLTAGEILSKDTYERPSFISFLVYAYNEIYSFGGISEIFKEPYAQKISSLFDGSKTTAEIDAQLTNRLNELFQGEFLDNFTGDMDNVVAQTFRDNSVLDWGPDAPVMLIHGNADTYVPYQNAVKAKQTLEQNGGDISLVTIEGGTHETSVFPAIRHTINWFDTLRDTEKVIASNLK